MGPYLRLFYDLTDTTDEREQLCRELMHGRDWDADISMARQALDDVARMAARPDKVRKGAWWWLNTHLDEMLTILNKARLSDTLLAQEIAAVLQTVRESGDRHPNFPRKSTLPDWVGRALPVLHELWCLGARRHGVHKRKDVVSPALQFMTDAINLFRPEATVASINYQWSKLNHKSPK